MKIDLGCGSNKRPGFVGVDILQSADADFVVDLNIGPYPFEDGVADVIWSNHVLEHLDNPLVCMGEIHRILKPGGVAYIHLPHPSAINCVWGHVQHNHALPRDWFMGVCDSLGLEMESYRLFYWIVGDYEQYFYKRLIGRVLNFLANDIHQRVFERLCIYWFGGFNEMRMVIRKK